MFTRLTVAREGSVNFNMSGCSKDTLAVLRTRLVEAAVTRVCDVSLEDLHAPTRCKARVAFARQMAMYLSHVALGVSLTRTGACFGRDRTTASHACRVIEDRRDDPTFDLQLCSLEEALSKMAARLDGSVPVDPGGIKKEGRR